MLPPHPQLSFPTPRYFNFHALSRPFLRRRLAIGESPSEVIYSTHLASSSTVPLPTLPLTYGSQPSISQRFKNSCVPKLLSSIVPPQLLFTIFGRFSFGPMPSIQWYSSAKHPPGQRRTGTDKSFSALNTSVRYPLILGISEFSPTQRPP